MIQRLILEPPSETGVAGWRIVEFSDDGFELRTLREGTWLNAPPDWVRREIAIAGVQTVVGTAEPTGET
jgi:hypothetical protein